MSNEACATQPPRRQRGRGVSQVELIVTIAVASIMSATVISKALPQAGKSTAAYQAQRLADDLRHTRLLAMSWGQTLVFSADSATYRVSCASVGSCNQATPSATICPNPSLVVIDPGHHGPFCVPLENSVTLSGPATLQFDLLGRPLTTASVSYQLTSGGSTIATVTVAPVTGFIQTTILQ